MGGVLGTVIVSGIFGAVFTDGLTAHCLVMGLLGSVLSMCGDLTASAVKRHCGIKDYGSFLPGHGGMMDRIDSVLFSIAVWHVYFLFFLQAVVL